MKYDIAVTFTHAVNNTVVAVGYLTEQPIEDTLENVEYTRDALQMRLDKVGSLTIHDREDNIQLTVMSPVIAQCVMRCLITEVP